MTSEPTLSALFGVPLYIADNIGGGVTVEDMKSFEMTDNRPGMQNICEEMNVLGAPEMARLRRALMSHSLNFIYGNLKVYPKYEVDFVSSWVSRLKKGSNHTEHYHPCSQWSGVYYPVDQEGSAPLRFSRPLIDPQWIGGNLIPDTISGSNLTYQTYDMPSLGDRVVIFPSRQPHKVVWTPELTGDERYSIAFNIMLSGEYTTPAQTVRINAKPL